jgi:hypothetical protein
VNTPARSLKKAFVPSRRSMKSALENGRSRTFRLLRFTLAITSRPGSMYGSCCNRTAFATLKIAVLAPMPSASVVTAVTVNPGFFRRCLRENFTSAQILLRKSAASTAATLSFITVGLPKRRSASRRASSCGIPAAMLSAVRISMWDRSSALISCSTWERKNRFETRRKSDMALAHAYRRMARTPFTSCSKFFSASCNCFFPAAVSL